MTSTSRPTPTNPNPVDFGPNVHIFDPSMPMADITSTIVPIFQGQDTNQFGPERHAYLFKPGSYNLNVDVGYYMTVHGLGHSPNDVTITGGVQSLATSTEGLALNSFWRGVENLSIVPTTNGDISGWAVSQATFLRRVHIVHGQLFLFDWRYPTNYSSGGFIADSAIDNQIISGSQQQFVSRNSTLTKWIGGVWNMVFVGDEQPPSGSWPDQPFTVIDKTPVIREKPYLIFENDYAVQVPKLKKDSQGTSWSTVQDSATTLPISQFYIAKTTSDTADSINDALHQGYHLILTPGVYHLSRSLEVKYPDTVILGLGMATLVPDNGTPAMVIDDVDGVSISGIIFDAGSTRSSQLLVVGDASSSSDHSTNPTALFDLSCRVGGAAAGSTLNCVTINSNNVILDNIWIWRADHGNPGAVGWTVNSAENGLMVAGQNVVAYGLFVEHFQKFQTIWNGNGGQVYMYQSEIPYDIPDQNSWQQSSGGKGYASYKVGDHVSTHVGKGLGIYCNFDNQVELDNAIETPTGSGIQMNHLTTQWLNGKPFSAINHIINGTGDRVYDNGRNLNAKSAT
ncbi:hypothetical protein AYO21_05265 [Fonsecaea monophora]|uniref:Pectate lyase superfamily protein domain-containing protein n=1 Tax=Fonsecaea monophora TaxID=254056 RepID=A0A177F8J4_9EURO|nr:hypothetical protein AYO21_05265 [Fonsecaea monophora]KAH0833586.1 coagulation factor 5/8 type domain-containing protein [Fonsecaea pedrosoi]OAG40564.1 hypothetical protein AYO21_05265 [Fonsecaea monophora]